MNQKNIREASLKEEIIGGGGVPLNKINQISKLKAKSNANLILRFCPE
jgi:hypothetical protein